MIWHDGRIVGPGTLSVAIDDRVFEHGLGLFETFRSWSGRATLLPRHLLRLAESSAALGIDLGGVSLPDQPAVTMLLDASGLAADAMFRLTLTAGSDLGPPVAWMTARPLPAPEIVPMSLGLERGPIGPFEGAVHPHKMLNYWGRRVAFERARARGLDECLILGPDGEVLEGTRNSLLFVPRDEPSTLVAAGLVGPTLPGIMARVALEFAGRIGYEGRIGRVEIEGLYEAEMVFLTNSVRGVRPVGTIAGREVGQIRHKELVRQLTEELPRHLSTHEPAP